MMVSIIVMIYIRFWTPIAWTLVRADWQFDNFLLSPGLPDMRSHRLRSERRDQLSPTK